MKWTVPVFAAAGALPIAGAAFLACTEGSAGDTTDTTGEPATGSKECKAVTVPPMTDPI